MTRKARFIVERYMAKASETHEKDKSYEAYVEKHGKHFTDMLAEKASARMLNADGSKHSWLASQVKAAVTGFGLKIPDNATLGDITYLANMFYADMFPEILETEAACIKAALKMAKDPDGYEGQAFCRWHTDMKHKHVHIDFEEVM